MSRSHTYTLVVAAWKRVGKNMKPCRECHHEVSEQALSCPHCGAPFPSRDKKDGRGFVYKSKITLFDLPLLHVSFKYRPNTMPGSVAIC